MNIPTLKESLITHLPQWIDERIDNLVASNPAMTVVSAYLKRGAQNYLALNRERIGSAIEGSALFIANEQGEVNINTLFEDFKAMFDALPLYPFDLGFTHGTIGKGEIRIALPDNLLCTILFGNIQTISIKAEDFLALKSFLNCTESAL